MQLHFCLNLPSDLSLCDSFLTAPSLKQTTQVRYAQPTTGSPTSTMAENGTHPRRILRKGWTDVPSKRFTHLASAPPSIGDDTAFSEPPIRERMPLAETRPVQTEVTLVSKAFL